MNDRLLKYESATSKCPTCNEYFSTENNFDKHRTGEYGNGSRRCMTLNEIIAFGMKQDRKGVWKIPMTESTRERFSSESEQQT